MSKKPLFTTKHLVIVSLLSAIGALLQIFGAVPIPFLFPDYLKIDLGDVPAVIAGIAISPLAGVFVELIKNLIDLLNTNSGGIGQLANFLVGTALVLPISIIYKYNKGPKGFITGAVVSVITMAVVGCLLNYFILVPMYTGTQPDMKYILGTFGPFNAFKGSIVMVVTFILNKFLGKHIYS